jgi:thiol-disulfide isomerase/thioredoxin
MKKAFLLISLFFFLSTTHAQQIKRWKMNDLLEYMEKSDSALVVNFWATFCGPCIEEIPYFQTIAAKYKEQKVKLLLVSLDFKEYYPQKIAAFAKRFGFTAEIVWLDEEKPDEFCPKIDSTWSGAMPATLFVNKAKNYRKFIEAQMKPDEVEAVIKNMIGVK